MTPKPTSESHRPGRVARAETARVVVLALLLTNVPWAVALPVALTRPPSGLPVVVLWLLVVGAGIGYVLVLWAAVTPWIEAAHRRLMMAAVVGVTLALWPVAYAWAEPGEEPWAWLAAFTIGVAPLVLWWPMAVMLGAALTGAAVLGALLWGQSVADNLVFVVGGAAVVALLGQALVWMLRLLVAAEAAREIEGSLVVSQERLRLARELHDVLGHRLGIIALKAEVAGGLAAGDIARVREETEEIRTLATSTLAEVRRALHGRSTLDLEEQLRSALLVLNSAGIDTDIDVEPSGLVPAESQLLAAVLREALTNLLRHSDARRVSILLAGETGTRTLVIVNDHPRPAAGERGTGLAGLADRCSEVGARLWSGPVGERFEVRVQLAPR